MNKRELIEYIKNEDALAKEGTDVLRHAVQGQIARLCRPYYFTAYILKSSSFPLVDDEDTEENKESNEFYDVYPVASCQSISLSTAIGVMMDKMAREAFASDTPVSAIKLVGPNQIKFNIENTTAHEVVLMSSSEYEADTMVGQFIVLRTASEIVPENELISKVPEDLDLDTDFTGDFDEGFDGLDGGEGIDDPEF